MSYKFFLQLKQTILEDINSNNSFEQFLQFKNAIIEDYNKNDNSDNETNNSDDGIEHQVVNQNFMEFLKFKKAVAESLCIPNGPKAGAIAGIAQRKIKEKILI